MSIEASGFLPINLLTGFLGSGKTTLLKRILADSAFADTAVLINEFGEIGLDHDLVESVDGEMVLLRSGCVCCTVRGELAAALKELYSRRERGLVPPFRRVIIESTGLADPFPVLSTIKADPVLRHHFCAGNVITTVDAVNGLHQLDTYIESNRQAAVADRLIVTKTDLDPDRDGQVLHARLRRLNPDAPILIATDTDLDLSSLVAAQNNISPSSGLSQSGFYCEEPVRLVSSDGALHQAAISSISLSIDRPVDWTAFGLWLTMLLNRHGERVLRVKGILNLSGEERPVAIHGVQHLVHTPVHMDRWPSEDRTSRLVFILDGLDGALLKRSFEAFTLAQMPSAASTFIAAAQ
ncbi:MULTISPECIES: GTP-binding protein [unclassified Rhizobium]|jgi:G3E family GTPase|uniref:CobW family GTP-binding protein n=1 Tax=unclassified Rhizobium TaxID=2613769 RepID=UPI000646B2A9|nr:MULTISPECIES: GTP-binding protein [unclassified Rhizobium]MBN8953513.1 GTP-binding protein [Rhizobium tropici]OJY73283.1 MAG: cobalamin biosynthesis protein CobW [Rhizobium sp. 60-20]RKD72254.1 G3E family GTPase [Rhizobium sp. WW_1]